MKKEDLGLADAIKRIKELDGIKPESQAQSVNKLQIVREHSYTDAKGQEIWQKIKLSDNTFRCRRREGDSWIYNLNGVARLPYRYDKIKDERCIFVAEGEKDADTLAALGFASTSGPTGKDAWPDELTPLFVGKEVRIIYDVGQDEAALNLAKKLSSVTPYIYILKVPLPNHEDDITDYLLQFSTKHEMTEAFQGILAKEVKYSASLPQDVSPLSLLLSEVESKDVPWLWKDFIPLGRATLISGDPGSAKTWLCLDLASRLSRGADWPDGCPGSHTPAQTYYITVEDDLNDTIRPRVDFLGGDVTLIAAFNPENPIHLDLSTADGLKRFENEIIRLGNVRLVVVDPIIDFSGKVNPNTAEEVRGLLTPLIKLAAKHNFALVLIGHLNKAQTLSAIYRAGGSTSGWLGKCRASFMVIRDVDDPSLRHVIPIKANLSRQNLPQLEFRINRDKFDIEVSKQQIDLGEQLNPQKGREPRERDEAIKWIKNYFDGHNEIPSMEVEEAAKQDGISESTLKRAKSMAGFKSVKRKDSSGMTIWAWARRSVIQ